LWQDISKHFDKSNLSTIETFARVCVNTLKGNEKSKPDNNTEKNIFCIFLQTNQGQENVLVFYSG
jgi:hypothetical protein